MLINIYGEISLDWLVEDASKIDERWGGAGLYAAITAARQGVITNLLTVFGPELPDYAKGNWRDLGVSLEFAKSSSAISLPKYIVTGFGQYCRKRSRPLTTVKLDISYDPGLPPGSDALLVFPINHSFPVGLLAEARKQNVPVFLDPKPNQLSINDARGLISFADCLLINEEEAQKLTRKQNIVDAICALKQMDIQQIIVKQGIRGCHIIAGEQEYRIPAFSSKAECTLGSGDVFAGAFVTEYIKTRDIVFSAKLACCVAANFIEQRETEAVISTDAAKYDMRIRTQINLPDINGQSIYLAGPFFCQQELSWVNSVCFALEDAGFRVQSPSRENGIITDSTTQEGRREIFLRDIALLEQSDLVVALFDHDDPGTHFEVGYALRMGKTVFALKTSRDPLNNMLQFGCKSISNSLERLIEELYEHYR